MSAARQTAIPWVDRDQPLPPASAAWGADAPMPGLLAAGTDMSATRLLEAYRMGAFPWYAENQPVLWWSPSPRMVLHVHSFRLHRSLRKWIQSGLRNDRLSVVFDHDFRGVIEACARVRRPTQSGTWIMPELIDAYTDLHRIGCAHSVETWWDGVRVGGLYCVNIGGMVYGESMFSLMPNASKVALSALVAFCVANGMDAIDCQQETEHLAFMGAQPIPGTDFNALVAQKLAQNSPTWEFNPQMWQSLDSRIKAQHLP